MPIASSPDDEGGDEASRKAEVFFDRGKTVADTDNYEYAIEMYILGLEVDPENVEAHQTLREISLKRKASGGRDMGMSERMKMPAAEDDKQAMLNAEKLLAYDPGNVQRMLNVLRAAHAAGLSETVAWIWPIVQRAMGDQQ